MRSLLMLGIIVSLCACNGPGNTPPPTNSDSTSAAADTSIVQIKYDSTLIALADSADLFKNQQYHYDIDDSIIVPASRNSILRIKTGASTFPEGIMGPVVSYTVKWEEAAALPSNTIVSIRFSHDRDNWSPWTQLKIDKEGSSPSDTVFFTKPAFLSDTFSYYQIQIESNNSKRGFMPGFFRIFFINPGQTPPALIPDSTTTAAAAPQCHCPLSAFLTRTQWGCETGQGSPAWPPQTHTVTHLIIHHSDNPNNSPDWGAVVRSIWVYHAKTRGWGDIGYNWLIDPNGVLYEGRAGSNGGVADIMGAHMCARNRGAMGICMLGNYMTTDITSKAKARLIGTLTWKCCISNINPLGTGTHAGSGLSLNFISGHRSGCDPGYTDCPGNKLFQDIPSIRISVSDSLAKCKAQ